MILSRIELTPISDNREKILELLQFSVHRLEATPGCLRSELYEAFGGQGSILYIERWRSWDELYRYVQSTNYLSVLNAMDLARDPPEVSFYEVSEMQSMDLIVSLRSS